MEDRFQRGMRTRRATLGDGYVDGTLAGQTPWDTAFQRLITEGAWGDVWSSDAIAPRERSMVTLALLAGLGNFEELELHLRATVNTGASRQDIIEVFQHVAIYAGAPRANHALKIARRVFAAQESEGAAAGATEGPPDRGGTGS